MPLFEYKPASRSISARPRRPTTAPDSPLINRVHHKSSPANRCVPRTLTLQEGSVQRRYRHHREDRSRRTGTLNPPRRPAGAIRIRRVGRSLPGLRGDHPQGTGLGVPGGGDSGGHAALHAAPAQPDLYRDHPRQAVALSDWTETSSGHRGTQRPVPQALLWTPEQLKSPQPSEGYGVRVRGVFFPTRIVACMCFCQNDFVGCVVLALSGLPGEVSSSVSVPSSVLFASSFVVSSVAFGRHS